MKKTFKTMLALMAGAMTFTGCTSDILENTPEQIPSAFKPMTFTAIQEGDATRAAIDATDGVSINWTKGDKISIFDGVADEDGNLAREFVLTGEGGSTSGTFTGTAKEGAEAYYALYPCVLESVYQVTEGDREVTEEDLEKLGLFSGMFEGQKMMYEMMSGMMGPEEAANQIANELEGSNYEYQNLSDEGKTIVLAYIKGEMIRATDITEKGVQRDGDSFTEIVLPAKQTVAEGQYVDPKAMLMIAKSTDASTLEFKNVCAYVKVTPTFDCSSIVFKSNNMENLAGTLTVDYNEGAPTTTVTAKTGTSTVTLNGTIAKNNAYYIAVLPATLASGFTIKFEDEYGKVLSSKSTTKENVTFARNKVINLGSFDAAPDTDPTSVDLGLSVKWATANVGALNPDDNGYFFAWGETAPRSNNWATEKPYTWANAPFNNGNSGFDADYFNANKSEWVDENGNLKPEYDAATVIMGSEWRMPTQAEIQELIAGCDYEWTSIGGTYGWKFTSKTNGNSIFIPMAGYREDSTYYPFTGIYETPNFYWTSTLYNTGYEACTMFISSYKPQASCKHRINGYSVRAVQNESAE